MVGSHFCSPWQLSNRTHKLLGFVLSSAASRVPEESALVPMLSRRVVALAMNSLSCDNVCVYIMVVVISGGSTYIFHYHHHHCQQFIIDHVIDLVLDDYRAHVIFTCVTRLCCQSCWQKQPQCVIRSNPLQAAVVRVNFRHQLYRSVRVVMSSHSTNHGARSHLQSFCSTPVAATSVVITTTHGHVKRSVHSHHYHIQRWPYVRSTLTGRCICKVIEQHLRLGKWFTVRFQS